MWIFLAIIAIIVIFAISMYNRLVKSKNKVEDAWSGIDVQLQRRSDLVPNLVATVKGYATHEKELFEKISEARARAMTAGTRTEKAEAENMLTSSLRSLFAIAENYPELKANANFQQLQQQLSEIEDQLQLSRRYYNGAVRDNNNMVEGFPGNIFSGMFGFKGFEYFEAEVDARKNVKVEF
jgi:LemA protein